MGAGCGGKLLGCIATLYAHQTIHLGKDVLPICEATEGGEVRFDARQGAIKQAIRQDIKHLLDHIISKLVPQQRLKSALRINLIQDPFTVLGGTKDDALFDDVGCKLVTTEIKDPRGQHRDQSGTISGGGVLKDMLDDVVAVLILTQLAALANQLIQ